jgi:branched-chain amino acid aminotransferase
LAEVSAYKPDSSADIYYEVVRIIGRKFLFLDDHLERLKFSIRNSGIIFPGNKAILESLKILLNENPFTEGNIKICLCQKEGKEPELHCFFTPWIYPDENSYQKGVQMVSYSHERPNPGIKKWDDKFRSDVRQYIQDHGVYEALLLNKQGEISEGSRSNVFFIDAFNKLITPPEHSVLPGITRKYVLQICRDQGLEVEERVISMKELNVLSACFISGTSPKVLPVCQIDQHRFRANHPVLRTIMKQFDTILNTFLKTID